jgi:hypothetical protein
MFLMGEFLKTGKTATEQTQHATQRLILDSQRESEQDK